jgi:hypothetical protein
MKTIFKIIIGVIIALIILAIGGCVLTYYVADSAVESIDKSIKKDEQKQANKDELLKGMLAKAKVEEHKDEYSFTVDYTMVNDSKESFDYIQLNADVFDSKGTKLDNTMSNITNVQPGQTFKITLDLYEEGATTYKVTSISSTAD